MFVSVDGMMKTLAKISASAAALAASAALAPTAVADQTSAARHGQTTTIRIQHRDDDELWGGRGDRRGDRGWGGDRRGWGGEYGRLTQAGAVDVCYRAMNRELGGRQYWSIQYDGEPRLREERHGYELRGRVRLHGPRGFSHLETVCELNGNRVSRFYVAR